MAMGSRIVVAVEDEDIRALVAWVLRGLGGAVDPAQTARAGLEKLHAEPAHLVVLDLPLAAGEAWELLRRIGRAHAPPVILLGSGGDPRWLRRAVQEGVAGLLLKPFRMGDLLACCERTLRAAARGPLQLARERRYQRRRRLSVELQAAAEEQGRLAAGTLVDLSLAGAQLELATPLRIGERLLVDVPPPERAAPILRLRGSVRWRSASAAGFAHGVGLEARAEEQGALRELLGPPPDARSDEAHPSG